MDRLWVHFFLKNQENTTSQQKIFIIRNYEFRQLPQIPSKTFSVFYNRVEAAGKTCNFRECTKGCRAEEFVFRN